MSIKVSLPPPNSLAASTSLVLETQAIHLLAVSRVQMNETRELSAQQLLLLRMLLPGVLDCSASMSLLESGPEISGVFLCLLAPRSTLTQKGRVPSN